MREGMEEGERGGLLEETLLSAGLSFVMKRVRSVEVPFHKTGNLKSGRTAESISSIPVPFWFDQTGDSSSVGEK